MPGAVRRGHSRRHFLLGMARSLALVGAGGLIWGHLISKSQASRFSLRPPGALSESDFLATCIKCGLCVEACPFETLKLATAGSDTPIGTPSFEPRTIPCYMCPQTPCTVPCPTGALKSGTKINEAKMGLAVLVDQETCLAYQGLRCEVCYNACPLINKAITLEYQPQKRTGKHAFFLPKVHSDACTGCGLCEHACVLAEAAIKVFPLDLAKGRLGDNYRFGWMDGAKISDQFETAPAPEDTGTMNHILEEMGDTEGIIER